MRTLVVRLVLALQASAFQALFASMAALRNKCEALRVDGGEVATAIAISHSWDETKQMLREPPQGGLARRSTQKVSRNILVQRALVHACGLVAEPDGSKVEHTRSETMIVPATELYGKTTRFLAEGLRRGVPFPLFSASQSQELAKDVSVVVLSFLGDAASTNRRLMKLLAGITASNEWPKNVLLDLEQVCLLHQLHRIKVHVVDVHATVSLMHSLSKLVRAGAVLHLVTDYIGQLVEQRCRRVVAPPPPEGATQARRALDAIYKLDSAHHLLFGRRGVSKTRLAKDVEELLKMDNGGFGDGGGDLVHHCWDGRSGPCCGNLQETKSRMTAAYVNLFICHGIPVATLSRWTHIQIVCSILCSSFVCRNISWKRWCMAWPPTPLQSIEQHNG